MKKRIYTCSKCKEEFDSLDELEFHIDQKHGFSEFSIEEVEELPEGYREIPFQKYPYLYYSPLENKVYDSLKDKYLSLENKEEIFRHPQAMFILTLLYSKELEQNGTGEGDIPSKAREEATLELIHHYLSNPSKIERLCKHFNSELERLIETLTRKSESCKLCGDHSFGYNEYIYKKLFIDKFENLRKKPNPSRYTIALTIDGKKTDVSLLGFIHCLTKHSSVLETASRLGKIKGIEKFLEELKKLETKTDNFERIVESFVKTPVKKEIKISSHKENLSKEEKDLLDWLSPRRYRRGEENEEEDRNSRQSKV